MNNCEYLENCPIFIKCEMGFLDKVIIKYYCNGIKIEFCERRKLRKDDKNIPENLLPNGDYI